YETANDFGRDIEHYLNDEPVQACPPSAWYRVRKFTRRNKGTLAVAGLILFFLVLLGAGAGWAVRDREALENEIALDRTARQLALEQEVTRALAEVQSTYERNQLPEAMATVKRAEGLLAGRESTPEELRRRVRQW